MSGVSPTSGVSAGGGGGGVSVPDTRKLAPLLNKLGKTATRGVVLGDSTAYNMANQGGSGVMYTGAQIIPDMLSMTPGLSQLRSLLSIVNRGQNGQTISSGNNGVSGGWINSVLASPTSSGVNTTVQSNTGTPADEAGTNQVIQFQGYIDNGSGSAGTILHITSMTSGNLGSAGANPLAALGIAANTSITSPGTGTGTVGTYNINNSQLLFSAGAPGTFTATGAYDVSLPKIIAENYDFAFISSFGINDTRGALGVGAVYPDFRGAPAYAFGAATNATSAKGVCANVIAQAILSVIQQLVGGNPNIGIIVDRPNPGVSGFPASGFVAPGNANTATTFTAGNGGVSGNTLAVTAGGANVIVGCQISGPGITAGQCYVTGYTGGATGTLTMSQPYAVANASTITNASATVTAQDAMDVLTWAYTVILPSLNPPNTAFMDLCGGLFPQAPAAFDVNNTDRSDSLLLGEGNGGSGLHPSSPAGYFAKLAGMGSMLLPPDQQILLAPNLPTPANYRLNTLQIISNHQEKTVGLGWSAPLQDTSFGLDTIDWYPVFQLQINTIGANFLRLQAIDSPITIGVGFNAAATYALFGASSTSTTAASAAVLGLCVGDVLVFPSVVGPNGSAPYVCRLRNMPNLAIGGPAWQFATTGGQAINGNDDGNFINNNQGLFVGAGALATVYRHRTAFSPVARSLLMQKGQTLYQSSEYPNAYRCSLVFSNSLGGFVSGYATPNGYLVLAPLLNEIAANGKTLAQGSHTIVGADVLSIAGLDFGSPGTPVSLTSLGATIVPPSASVGQQSVTAIAGNVLSCAANYANGQCVEFVAGSATGLTNNFPYFVVASTPGTSFSVALTPGGAAVVCSAPVGLFAQAKPNATTISGIAGVNPGRLIVPQGLLFSAS